MDNQEQSAPSHSSAMMSAGFWGIVGGAVGYGLGMIDDHRTHGLTKWVLAALGGLISAITAAYTTLKVERNEERARAANHSTTEAPVATATITSVLPPGNDTPAAAVNGAQNDGRLGAGQSLERTA